MILIFSKTTVRLGDIRDTSCTFGTNWDEDHDIIM